MGFRLRKSIKIAPGVRLNVSKTGIGASAGVGAGRYSVHSSGRRTVSARSGVPGVYYQKSVGGSRRGSSVLGFLWACSPFPWPSAVAVAGVSRGALSRSALARRAEKRTSTKTSFSCSTRSRSVPQTPRPPSTCTTTVLAVQRRSTRATGSTQTPKIAEGSSSSTTRRSYGTKCRVPMTTRFTKCLDEHDVLRAFRSEPAPSSSTYIVNEGGEGATALLADDSRSAERGRRPSSRATCGSRRTANSGRAPRATYGESYESRSP
jgi:Protein of unknown function (DUF4236)